MQFARWRFNYAVNFGNTNYGQQFQGTIGAGYPSAQFKGAPFMMVKSRPLKQIPRWHSHTLLMAEIRTIKWFGDYMGWSDQRRGNGLRRTDRRGHFIAER